MKSRRDLIQHSLAAALAGGVPSLHPLLARPRNSDPLAPHFLVFVQIYGAWDVCLAFDPKDRETRLSDGDRAFDQPYSMQEVKQVGPHLLAPGGMALAPFADRMTVINGIDMEIDAGHSPRNVMSGQTNGISVDKPFVQAILTERHPYLRSRLIPHLYGSYNGYFVPGAYAAKSVIISRKDAYNILSGTQSSQSLPRVGATTRAIAAQYQGLDRQQLNQYAKSLDQAVSLRQRLQESEVPSEVPVNPRQTAAFIGKLFGAGVLGSYTWSIGEEKTFDTHSNHYAQHALPAALEDIAAFCQQLQEMPWDEQSSIFDHTTVVVSAEYARTPLLNNFAGKDHNFRTNSLLYLGKNVRSARYGLSGEGPASAGLLQAHMGLPIDYQTGFARADGEKLYMRNLWAGSGDILGADLRAEFGTDTAPVQFLRRS